MSPTMKEAEPKECLKSEDKDLKSTKKMKNLFKRDVSFSTKKTASSLSITEKAKNYFKLQLPSFFNKVLQGDSPPKGSQEVGMSSRKLVKFSDYIEV